MLYIHNNETVSHVIFIHAYQNITSIPSDLVPSIKSVDEAFPTIATDLMLVQGTFGPDVSCCYNVSRLIICMIVTLVVCIACGSRQCQEKYPSK